MNRVLEVLLRAQIELVRDLEFERADREFCSDARDPCAVVSLRRDSIVLVVYERDFEVWDHLAVSGGPYVVITAGSTTSITE